jgi:predicted Rossmann fold flavoprotein
MMTDKITVGIVGAGPSGIMAALEAARRGTRAILFEANALVGRKLLVTGNGRCNISNAHATASRYTCADPSFIETALERFGHRRTLDRLAEMGILTYATDDGWCYPLSNSAATVAATLTTALDLAGVEIHLNTRIADLRRERGGFALDVGDGRRPHRVDRLVLASGGMAYPALGSRGDLYPVLERMGHTIVAPRPALAPIVADVRRLHKLQGVRMDLGLTLYEGKGDRERVLGHTVGNAIFTQFGFSGPAAMDLSHLISTRPGADLTLEIDLLPHYRREMQGLLERMAGRRDARRLPLRVALGAALPEKVPPVIMTLAGLSDDTSLADLPRDELSTMLERLTRLRVAVKGTHGFEFAQVSTGGVPVGEVDPHTMASRIVPGLYLAGEVLDVVGPCGGYNLQFAWTSGYLAGAGAAGTPPLKK